MKKALYLFDFTNFEYTAEIAAMAGFEHVGVGLCGYTMRSPMEWEKNAENMARILRKNGLKCVQTHLPCYEPNISSEIRDEAFEEIILRGVTATRILGADWCVHHPRSSVNFDYDKKRAFDDNRQDLERYLVRAKDEGVGIAVENMVLFPGPVWFGVDYHDVIDLVDSFSDESMGICFDVGHINTTDFSYEDATKEMGSRIKCTHIHDNLGTVDMHVPPFMGSIDWENVMKQFKSIGYAGDLTLEIVFRNLPFQSSEMVKSFMKLCHCGLETLEDYMK